MSIQRWKSTPAWFDGAMQARSDGEYVLYADHVAAVAEAEARILDSYAVRASSWEQGRDAERARIRAAVQALAPIDQRVDENGFVSLVYDKSEVLAIIDALRGDK